MSRFRTEPVDRLPSSPLERQQSILADDDDDLFVEGTNKPGSDDQARIRRTAPTRHSITSRPTRKPSIKTNSTSDVSYTIIVL